MKSTTTCLGGRPPLGQNMQRHKCYDLVHAFQLAVLAFKRLDALTFFRGLAIAESAITLGLAV